MSTQWASLAPEEITTGMTRSVMGQDWNMFAGLSERSGARQKGVCSMTGWEVRAELQRESAKQHLYVSHFSESELFSFPHYQDCIYNLI